MVVVRASGLVTCAIAEVDPRYLSGPRYSASTAGSTAGVFGGVDVDPGDVEDAAGLESALLARSRGAEPGRVRAVHRPHVQLVTGCSG